MSSAVLEAVQTAAAEYQLVKRLPPCARRSKLGVDAEADQMTRELLEAAAEQLVVDRSVHSVLPRRPYWLEIR